jgi:hypothetical protein
MAQFDAIAAYSIGERTAVITPIKLVMGTLIFVFALFELLPGLRGLRFGRRYLALGGLLSGFFGGLSGHQGALRSAFLLKVGITTEAFVGTNAVIGFMVDVARLTIYAAVFFMAGTTGNGPIAANGWPLILTGILAAFSGVLIGKKYLHKVTMKTIQTIAGFLLLGISLALTTGII